MVQERPYIDGLVAGSWILFVCGQHGAQTKRPESKRPEGQNVRRQNICGTKHPEKQNVWNDKTSGRTKRPKVQKVRKIKRPWGQNVRTDKNVQRQNVLVAYFQYILYCIY
jgi:hypothetical protein